MFKAKPRKLVVCKICNKEFVCPPRIKDSGKYKRILIKSPSSVKFLNWIKDYNCIPKQYAYKFGNHRRQTDRYND